MADATMIFVQPMSSPTNPTLVEFFVPSLSFAVTGQPGAKLHERATPGLGDPDG
jgi:hypothetical protein